jgi:hypothetical protein
VIIVSPQRAGKGNKINPPKGGFLIILCLIL